MHLRFDEEEGGGGAPGCSAAQTTAFECVANVRVDYDSQDTCYVLHLAHSPAASIAAAALSNRRLKLYTLRCACVRQGRGRGRGEGGSDAARAGRRAPARACGGGGRASPPPSLPPSSPPPHPPRPALGDSTLWVSCLGMGAPSLPPTFACPKRLPPCCTPAPRTAVCVGGTRAAGSRQARRRGVAA